MKKIILAIAVSVVIVGLFAPGVGATEPRKDLTIGMIVPSMANEFWVRLSKFAEKAAEELGFKLVVLDSRDSGDVQIKNAEDLISRKVDGLTFVAYWYTGPRVLQMCERAGIPVVIMDTYVVGVKPQEEYKQYIAYIGPYNFKAGYGIADYLVKHVQPGADGKKKLVALYGTLGTSVAEERRVGLMACLSEHPDVALVGGQTANFRRDDGMKVMEDFLIAHSDIQAVWCANDEMALGAIMAIENAGKQKDIIVGGMDLNDEAVQAIIDGKYAYSAGGHWLQGGFAVTMLYDYLNGYKIAKEDSHVELVLAEVPDKETAIKLRNEWLPFPKWDFKEYSKTYSGPSVKAYTELVIK
jgi:ABC-type sugar transport system substrate-binding protein